jgi:tripartite-type tricarboxylate transporter receptor subunit TctC
MDQPIIVDNKAGGGGIIGFGEVARQPADGHTLMFPSILAVTNPALMPNYPFDIGRDFSAVTVVGFIPHALVVRPNFPAKDLAELIAMAKAKPNEIAYGSSGNGTSAHLAGAMFASRADIRVTHVPYRGAGPALQDLLGGQIQYMFLDMSSALSLIQAGKLRPLAVAPARRFQGLPDVPTLAEQGFPGFDIRAWYGLLVRSGTPPATIERLHAEVKTALDSREVRELFKAQGIEPSGMPPAEFQQLIKTDLAQWKRTIEQLGIKLE